MSIIDYVSIGVFILSVISSVISILVSKFKNKNKLEEYKSGTERNKKVIELISEVIPKAMMIAEKTGVKGDTKKLIASSQILLDCMNRDIEYTGISNVIDEFIEKLISFSKEVNSVSVNKEV